MDGILVTLPILLAYGKSPKYPGETSDTLSSSLTVSTLVLAQLGYNESEMSILE
jgi:hypothetical protein